jgi:DNA-binding CsgD family transcriptional regulator
MEGVPGIGKTRLLAEAMRMARRMSVRVGLGEADPADSVVELAPLLRALFDGPTPLLERSALPSIRASAEQRYWVVQELGSLLEHAAAQGPMLVCLDDLQWADRGTLAALRTLLRLLESLPIAWVVAARPVQGGNGLGGLVAELESAGARRIVLEPLSPEVVGELAAELLGARPDERLLELLSNAAGNPFFLVELLQGLRDERLVQFEDGVARLAQMRLPERVATGMRHRLARLSESTRQLAIAAASLGRSFTVAQLASMLHVPPASLVTPVEQLLAADVFAEHGDQLGFRHDLVRDAVRASTTTSARRALDRQAVDVLLAGGAIPVEVAAQLATSAEPGDEVAVRMLKDAAAAISAVDPSAAAALAQRALELAPGGYALVGELVATTTILLHAAGRVREAQAFAEEHLRDVRPVAEEAAVCLSIATMFALSPDVRAQAGRRALALHGLRPRTRAQHQARLAYNLVQAGRPQEAAAVVEECRATVEAAGDLASRSILHLAEGALLYVGGEFDRALSVHEQAMRDGFGPGELTRERVAQQWRSEVLAVLDRFDESLDVISTGIAAAQRERQAFVLDFFETWRGRQLFQIGRLPDAAAALEERLGAAPERPIVATLYAAGMVALGRVAIHTGDETRKRKTLAIAERMLAIGTPANQGHGAWLLALAAMAAGRAVDARVMLDAGRASAETLLPLYPVDVTDDPQLVRIALGAGDPQLASAVVRSAEERARQNPTIDTVRAAAAHARGLLETDAELLSEACRLFDEGPRRLALASALEDLGVTQLRSGRGELAVETLDRALALYVETGATWDAGRVRGRLRAAGVRRRLAKGTRPEIGWGALTDSELAVVTLIASGLTNRDAAEQLFVSPHTVNSHLRHAFTKLGVNSRVELARVVAAQAAPDPTLD